jgi:hypothetical protein
MAMQVLCNEDRNFFYQHKIRSSSRHEFENCSSMIISHRHREVQEEEEEREREREKFTLASVARSRKVCRRA